MQEIKLFYLTHCPYCKQARKVIDQLYTENPSFKKIAIRWIEESQEPQIADAYDYYHVPTIFVGDEKKYEAHPGESYNECYQMIKDVFSEIMGE